MGVNPRLQVGRRLSLPRNPIQTAYGLVAGYRSIIIDVLQRLRFHERADDANPAKHGTHQATAERSCIDSFRRPTTTLIREEDVLHKLPLSSVIVLAMLAASAVPASAADVIVGLITKTNTNPFFVKMKEGADGKAKELGVKLSSFAGKVDGDNQSQVEAIESLIAAGAKASSSRRTTPLPSFRRSAKPAKPAYLSSRSTRRCSQPTPPTPPSRPTISRLAS
jgi:hypothetical protein